MANVYVAGSYARRETLAARAMTLVLDGHHVTSRWLSGNDQLAKQDQIDMDLADILRSDIVMFFNESSSMGVEYRSGGRHVELGYVKAMNDMGDKRRIIVIGWPENVFQHDAGVELHPSFESARAALSPAEAVA